MALFVRRPGRKPSWEDLAPRLVAAVEATGTAAVASTDPASTWVAWHLGPSIGQVQEAVGEVVGWQWAAVAPALDPGLPPPADQPTIWVRRSFTERALAVGLVRFYGTRSRYFSTDQERYRAQFAELMDSDRPERTGYPIVDHIVDALLELPDPEPGPPTGNPIDDLSGKLRRLGYEQLWAEAFKAVP